MALYIPFYDSLPDDPNLQALTDAINLPDTQVMGMLGCMWTWAINQRFDGKLSAIDWRSVERYARWAGEPKCFFNALVQVGFIAEEDDGYCMDYYWDVITEGLSKSREQRKGAAIRQQRHRDKQRDGKESSQDSNGNVTVTDPLRASDVTDTEVLPARDVTPYSKRNPNSSGEEAGNGGIVGDTSPRARARNRPNMALEMEEPTDKCYSTYETLIGPLTITITETLKSYLDDGIEDGLICAAIDDAVAYNKRNWKYINAILGNCFTLKCFTLTDYKRRQAEFVESKAAAKGTVHQLPTNSERRANTVQEVRQQLQAEREATH